MFRFLLIVLVAAAAGFAPSGVARSAVVTRSASPAMQLGNALGGMNEQLRKDMADDGVTLGPNQHCLPADEQNRTEQNRTEFSAEAAPGHGVCVAVDPCPGIRAHRPLRPPESIPNRRVDFTHTHTH